MKIYDMENTPKNPDQYWSLKRSATIYLLAASLVAICTILSTLFILLNKIRSGDGWAALPFLGLILSMILFIKLKEKKDLLEQYDANRDY